MERFFNLYSTTVALGGYTSGSGLLNVADTSAITLGSGDVTRFLVVRLVAGTLTPIVLLIATAVNSSTQFAVTAEGTDANALASDMVLNVNTAGSMEAIINDSNRVGLYSSIPATGRAGMSYCPTDGVLDRLVHDGSAWVPFIGGMKLKTPSIADFPTNVAGANITATTFTDIGGGVLLTGTAASGDNITAQLASLPSPPYEYIFRFWGWMVQQDYQMFGICLQDSGSGKFTLIGIAQRSGVGKLRYIYFNSANSYNSDAITEGTSILNPFSRSGLVHVMIGDDNSNRYMKLSGDGKSWNLLDSRARTDFLTPDRFGPMVIPYTTTTLKVSMTLVDVTRTI